jgi:hypothetical protein
MAEWLKAVDSKSIVRFNVPGVRIPLSPYIAQICIDQFDIRRGDRVAEGARLEIVCRATYRGFESPSLRP